MNRLKPLLLVALTALCFFTKPNNVFASHSAGGEIIYQHLRDSTYRIIFKFYRDCSGIAAPGQTSFTPPTPTNPNPANPKPSPYYTNPPIPNMYNPASTPTICIRNRCNSYKIEPQMALYQLSIPPGKPNGFPVSIGCSNSQSKCQSPNAIFPGYEEWWYYYDFTAPSRCDFWTFSVSINARNPNGNIGGPNMYIETTLNNAYAQGNSSPYFSIKPIPYACLNKQYFFNNGAVDSDGDSLFSDVIHPMTSPSNCGPGTGVPVNTLTPPINFSTNPIQTSNQFSLNGNTGQMVFTPTLITGGQTMTVRTREYRNGILIGLIMRDVQIQIVDPSLCPPVDPAVSTTDIEGGKIVNDTIQGCINERLKFCVSATIRNANGVVKVRSTASENLPGSVITESGQETPNVKHCVEWTPTAPGQYNFQAMIIDSTCSGPGLLGLQIRTFNIMIWGATVAFKDSTVCPGVPVQLSALGGADYLWSVLPGGDGKLSCTNCGSPLATINNTAQFEVLSQASSFCVNGSKSRVTLTRKPIPVFTPIPDDTTCPGSPMTLDLKPKPGVTYNVKWTPATYLNNANIPVPVTNPFNDTRYIAEIRSSESECTVYDTVDVEVLDGFAILTADTSVCEGETVKIRAIGDSRYKYLWEPSTSVSDATLLDPTIIPLKIGEETYTVTAKYKSALGTECRDSIANITINTEPIPQVAAGEDQVICYGDTMTLHGKYIPDNFPYVLSWSPAISLDKDNVARPVFTAQTSQTITFTASSPKAHCKASDDINLEVIKPEFLFVSPDTAICPGQSAQLRLSGPTIKNFVWAPDEAINDVNSFNPIVSPIVSKDYLVFGRDTNGCYDTQMVKVVVKPAAIVDLPASITVYPGQQHRMAPQGNALYFQWFPANGLSSSDIADPLITATVNTRYMVSARTEAGCEARDSIDVIVMPDSKLEMPNAFVPGLNSTLKVLHLGDAQLKTFAVFNRWGVKVFETNNINEGWDGRYNGEAQPMGVYVYTVEAQSPSGKVFTKQGNVTLIR
jgi:gliding motility-associated-like protein